MTLLKLRVNGASRRVDVADGRTLLSVLRDDLELTGCKYGCGEGQCGACTVLVDGKPTRACLTPAADVANRAITTIEGVEEGGRLHPLQQAFIDQGAMQCGYCTPGMIVEGVAFLRKNPDPSERDIVRAMEGHVCRCCAYPRIVAAFRAAAPALKDKRS